MKRWGITCYLRDEQFCDDPMCVRKGCKMESAEPMSEHTPMPWSAASKYSSVVGVPIVNQQGRRIGNTALPGYPPEWDHMKRQAEIDAAFIVKAVNNHDALVQALRDVMKAANDPYEVARNALARLAANTRG